MKKSLLAICLLSSANIWGANLSDYRSKYFQNDLNLIQEELNQKEEVLSSALKIDSMALKSFFEREEFSKTDNKNDKKKAQISAFFKNKMDQAILESLRQKNLGAPQSFDSQWSVERFREEKLKRMSRKVIRSLNVGEVKYENGVALSPLTRFLGAIDTKIVSKKKEERTTPAQSRYFNEKHLVNHFLLNNSPLKDGKTVSDLLGDVKKISFTDGILHKIKFNKNDITIPAQLSMLLTFRTGEDDAYLKVQKILIKYLEEQNTVFERRLRDINNPADGFFDFINNSVAFGFFRSLYNGEGLKNIKDRKLIERMQVAEQFYNYAEGLHFKNDQAQKVFIEKRVALNKKVLPFLKKTYFDSLAINKALNKLSKQQVSFLLGFLYFARKGDVLTDVEIVNEDDSQTLTRKLGDEMNNIERQSVDEDNDDLKSRYLKAKYKEMNSDYYFYKTQGAQIDRLFMTLKQERIIKQSTTELINNL